MKDHTMIGINSSLGPVQALQLQVAARSDPSQKSSDDTRARDTASDKGQTAFELDLTMPRNLPDKLPKAHHMDFLTQMEAIVAANSTQETTSDLSTDAARLQALQIRQQLESLPHGISNRASQLALAFFR
ncbi:MAG: hypothetical protein ACK5XZ_08625 [Hyphomonadaceae bacterium]|uniref:hypothetical protein n=1 Tax=Aquidulcibacter sp. TaxID=2052990 RepID=UPI0026301CD8|nr:hypothetical protein [Aquidulcibacter sp.]MCE2892107.1 hypothetical protein [Hyphomonadaceae bacterium]